MTRLVSGRVTAWRTQLLLHLLDGFHEFLVHQKLTCTAISWCLDRISSWNKSTDNANSTKAEEPVVEKCHDFCVTATVTSVGRKMKDLADEAQRVFKYKLQLFTEWSLVTRSEDIFLNYELKLRTTLAGCSI